MNDRKKSKKCNRTSVTEGQFYSKWDRVGWFIEKVRVKHNWNSESYVSGSIDSKTGGIHNVSYSQTSKCCKSLKNIYINNPTLNNDMCLHMLKHCEFENYMIFFGKCKLQMIRMYEQTKYWKFASKEKICKNMSCVNKCTDNFPCKS